MALDKLTERKRDKTRGKTRETTKYLDFMLHAMGMGLTESFENNNVINLFISFSIMDSICKVDSGCENHMGD